MMHTAQELLAKHNIAYVPTKKSNYATNCPNCSGGYLNVKVERDGVAWFCHQCQERGRESFEQNSAKSGGGLGPIKATHDYTDEGGKLLFQVLRFEPVGQLKQFRQRTGPDQEKWSIKGVRIVPFRLPELIEDVAAEHVVFIVEGEKDVNTLRARNIPATCNPMGAGKWRDDFGPIFDGADVVICGDNDQPGRDHVLKVARALRGHAAHIRVLDLKSIWPEIEESDDITDWFAAGHSAEELWSTCDQLKDWQEPAATNGKDSAKEEAGSTEHDFPLISFENIVLDTGRRGYSVKGLLPRSGLVVIWGPPKCGKSFWATDVGLHIALNWEYRGRRVQQATVVYIILEGRHGFPARIEAFKQHHGVQSAPFHLITKPLDLVRKADALIASIEAQLGDERPGVVFIDTQNRSLAGSESKDEDMAAYLAAAGKIEEKFGCLIVIIHHCGIDATRPRGHTSLSGTVEVQIAVKRGGDGEVITTVELAKDMEEGTEIFSRLVPVDVGADPDGDPITSLVVIPVNSAAPKAAKRNVKLPKGAQIALRALQEAIAEGGEVPPASNHIPPSVKAVSIERWRDYENVTDHRPTTPPPSSEGGRLCEWRIQLARVLTEGSIRDGSGTRAGHAQPCCSVTCELLTPTHCFVCLNRQTDLMRWTTLRPL